MKNNMAAAARFGTDPRPVQPNGIYKFTVRVEIPVTFPATAVTEEMTTWDDLRAIAAHDMEQRLPSDLLEFAEIVVLTGPGSGGYYPDGMEYDTSFAAREVLSKVPVAGLPIITRKEG